ncbi:MAG TPA: FAD-dependent oxidoreductase [Candidatus Binatia bacterium]|jgi:thioredoxin reductase (NADPH)|nr:FAD-dependent oxidoreductase [Candidatus Binatia bacterium]
MSDYDVIIIGSGLAGLTAGLFAARHGLSTLVLESNVPGGHLISIEKIEDFPGFPNTIPGYELCPNLQRQAADQGVEFQRAEVFGIQTRNRFWSVSTEEETHRAKAIVVATGSALKNLGVPGEEKLTGRGVSHCASCDGPLYDGQVVGVVGGGDSALQEALTLANFAERILIFHNGDNFPAQHSYRQRVLENSKIIPRYRTVVEEVLGDAIVTGVRARNLLTDEVSKIDLAGVFVYVGMKPNTALLHHIVKLTGTGHVPTNGWMKTERDGLYAVGDIREDSAAQAITSAGDGATAAIAAYRYIKETFSE